MDEPGHQRGSLRPCADGEGSESAEAGLDAAARSLRAWLDRQQFSDLSTPEVTAFFTDSVADWATDQGYEVQREVELPTATRQNRTGRLDLQLRHRSRKGRPISIEVDRDTKERALEKLVKAAELGHLALWLRWSRTPVALPNPPTVSTSRPGPPPARVRPLGLGRLRNRLGVGVAEHLTFEVVAGHGVKQRRRTLQYVTVSRSRIGDIARASLAKPNPEVITAESTSVSAVDWHISGRPSWSGPYTPQPCLPMQR
ncbi:hypothetical protein [Streptomyces sp. NPDC004783]|uniref:hypothetical protein n=1 Tax=Streptomyces sp. NPDC004783 TaxID=3154459 RepID=UPI0033ACE6E6